MRINIEKSSLHDILDMRKLYLQENNFQIRYNACHERNWTDSYLLKIDAQIVGYGSVKGLEKLSDRDTIFEVYILPHFRKHAAALFATLIQISAVSYLECQTNDLLTSSMLYEFGKNIHSEVVLFAEDVTTHWHKPGVIFRETTEKDDVFGKKGDDRGAYVLEEKGEIISTGGFLLHYNMPFADIYMETKESHWGRGYGSLIVQELKKVCYQAGRVPAARCNIANPASKATLLKAGMKVAGYMLKGKVK